jgi:hypothetical protein
MKSSTNLLIAALVVVSAPALSANIPNPDTHVDQKAEGYPQQPQGQATAPTKGPVEETAKNTPKAQPKESAKPAVKGQSPNKKAAAPKTQVPNTQAPKGNTGKPNDEHSDAGKAPAHGQPSNQESSRPWWKFWG